MNIKEQHLLEFSARLNVALDEFSAPLKGQGRQAYVGRLFDLSPKSVRRWLEGEGFPDTGRLREIALTLGVNAEWLLTGEGDKYPRIESSESFSPDEMALLLKYRQLSDDKKKATQTMVDALNQPEVVSKVG